MSMTRKATETIRIRPETWRRLNNLKEPGDTFDDVVTKLLDDAGEIDEGNPTMMTAATAE